jgi:hypothetical protein
MTVLSYNDLRMLVITVRLMASVDCVTKLWETFLWLPQNYFGIHIQRILTAKKSVARFLNVNATN